MTTKNNFDYTSIPGDLIYCDKRKLDDFDVDNPSSLNYYILEKLYDRFSHFADYEDFIKEILNSAYYICTVAFVDNHPDRRFGFFRRYVYYKMHFNSEYSGIILAIVLLIIRGNNWDNTPEKLRLSNAIKNEIINKEYGDIYTSHHSPFTSKLRRKVLTYLLS